MVCALITPLCPAVDAAAAAAETGIAISDLSFVVILLLKIPSICSSSLKIKEML